MCKISSKQSAAGSTKVMECSCFACVDVAGDHCLLPAELVELFQNHKFVGCVDQTKALVQHQVSVAELVLHRVSL